MGDFGSQLSTSFETEKVFDLLVCKCINKMTVYQHQLALEPKYKDEKWSKFYKESNGADHFKIGVSVAMLEARIVIFEHSCL